MNLRLLGNLIVVCFSLVGVGILSARGVIYGDWLYIAAAVLTAAIAVVNLYIAIDRMTRR